MLWGIFWSGYLDAMQYFENQYGQAATAAGGGVASPSARPSSASSGGGSIRGTPNMKRMTRSNSGGDISGGNGVVGLPMSVS